MNKNKNGVVLMMGALAMVTAFSMPVIVSAELTESQKKALETALKACESLPVTEVKACETTAINNAGSTTPTPAPTPTPTPAPTATKTATASLKGLISATTANTVTVGIFGNSTVNITSKTEVMYNGKPTAFNTPFGVVMFPGDRITVKYDPATMNATLVEAEGHGFAAIYTNKGVALPVTYIGIIGNTANNAFGMMMGGWYASVKLDTIAQVLINGVPATYLDIKVGDIVVEYVQNSFDLKAIFIKITR